MSVISDINIICINQKSKTIYNNDDIVVNCKKNPCNVYGDEWRILSMIKGYWHQITPVKRTFGIYDEEFFDLITIKHRCYASIENQTSFNINFVYDLISFYLNSSPIHKICLLFRLDFQKKQKIIGTIKFKDFMRKLENNKVLFDSAYIIEL